MKERPSRVGMATQFHSPHITPRLIVANAMVGPRSWIEGIFNRFVKRTEKFLDYNLNPIQKALIKLWNIAFPNVVLTGLIYEQWKEMGWQGVNPSTDFRFMQFSDILSALGPWKSSNNLSLSSKMTKTLHGTWKLKSAEEGETAVAEQQDSVSVPVSPSNTLRMYFQADGMLNEAEIPKVSKALEGAEGVSNLKVQVLEGIGTVELTKQTTVQATGVASNLVELIQGA
ncbi:Polynucleotidyl transferase, ribonuclease H-like superfamily protein, putative isoform 1 [Hibiscus syriacus]|uniref:Polynucleotidyl transferase, ribonuclease H-like superfamily protein, putative isoform 1 n=1 Tax=Hibiscus syriacus TaxID=106335 RepID=A0A6A2ZRU9_HIBSY|nr:Polynucleotidyl transferase, ribonuclease H-like superfamily protein, putative isoform 1 [Hibiscus syriacus]